MKRSHIRLMLTLRKAMQAFALFALFAACSISSYGQMEEGLNIDSLKRMLRSSPDDTLKVQAYISLGQQYENNQPDSAIHYYQKAGVLSEQLHYSAGMVQYISNYTAVLNVQGKFDESLKLNLEAVEICRQHHLSSSLMKALINTGVVYQYMNRYSLAADYYLQALPALEASGNLQALSFVYGNLCGLYRDLKQPSKALDYAGRALQLAEKNNDRFAVASAYNNLGNALKDMNKIGESIGYFHKARQVGMALNDMNIQETALINLGDAYLKKKSPQQYMAAFKAALPLADSLGDAYGKASALQGIAFGLFYQQQYREAAALLDTSMMFARKYDQKQVLSNMILLMSDIQIALGNLDAAEEYRALYDSLTNVLMSLPLLKNIQELEVKYDVEKKQRQLLGNKLLIAQRDRETLRQRHLLISTIIGIIILALLLFLGYRVYKQKQQLHSETIRMLQSQQEAVRLKAILEGEQRERQRISQEMHDDMGSDLTRMLFLSRTIHEPEEVAHKIQKTIKGLVKKMSEIIWVMNTRYDTLENLIAYTHATIDEMLQEAGIIYHVAITEDIPAVGLSQEFRRNVYLSVKEAVHNAIRHAGADEINIVVSISQQCLKIIVQDNGKGLDASAFQSSGNGLKNMQERIGNIKGQLHITSSEGATIIMEAPLAL